ncbi:MAG: LysM peptidoglycan-binding domain-containing protein [Chloroflexi bacterium]|nr:LysM peptidoglycan-binding domain-containing protein [Chloroflexota bacterium]
MGGVLVLAIIAAVILSSGQFPANGANSTPRETMPLVNLPTVVQAPSTPTFVVPTIAPAATMTPLPIDTPSPIPLTYTVQAGDTLAKIAGQFGVSVSALAEANNIKDPTRIRTGAVLVIPGKFVPTKTPTP